MKIAVCVLFLVAGSLSAADVTQWRGADRRGDYPETGLLKSWPEGGPKELWKTATLGAGYSSPTIVGDRIYLTGVKREDGKDVEMISGLTRDGKLLWQTVYGNAWTGQYPGVRSTPTWRDGELYIASGSGEVVKLDAATGKLLWRVDAKALYGGKNGNWGTSESPLVDERAVYFTAGGEQTTLVALSRKDGKLIWKSAPLNDVATYVTPTLIVHRGIKQIVGGTTNYLWGINPEDGTIQWKLDVRGVLNDVERKIKRWDIIANSLVYIDGKLLMSNGYNHGSILLQLNDAANAVTVVWKNFDLTSQHHGFAIINGHVYATAHNTGRFTCVELASGKTVSHQKIGNLQNAQIIMAEGLLYIYDSSRGNVILAKPVPEKGFEEISRFQIKDGGGEHWCHPVISGKKLYLRHGEVLLAYDLQEM